LAAAFGVAAAQGGDLPSAALCLLADAPGLAREGCWFHGDPVHLRADRDRLLLFAGPSLGVRPGESAALAESFNRHFADLGLCLVGTAPGRWYLHAAKAPRLRTSPLHLAAGRRLDAYLPQGPDARDWIRWQNEAQMLWFGHPVNRGREETGEPVLSGIWTWGGGTLPQPGGGPDLTLADHPLARGLALASGRPCLGLDALAEAWADWPDGGVGSVLIYWDRLLWPASDGDPPAWCAALEGLESLVARALALLAAGRVRSLVLDDGQGRRFELGAWGLRRFWRRRGTFALRLARAAQGAAAGRPPGGR
jgi:hypothetical protein